MISERHCLVVVEIGTGCESWTIKKAVCQRTDAFELWHVGEDLSLLDFKWIKPVNLKGNQPWIFITRTDAEAEVPVLWPPDAKSQLIGKDPDAGKDWRQEEKGTTEDEMIGWHHQFNEHELQQTPRDSEGQGAWCAAVYGVTKSQIWPSDGTTRVDFKRARVKAHRSQKE